MKSFNTNYTSVIIFKQRTFIMYSLNIFYGINNIIGVVYSSKHYVPILSNSVT